jgi:signal recognition particle receptor subunit beta
MIIDQFKNTIQLKIVFFGPAMSGKTKSLKKLFNFLGKKIYSIDNTVGRTLYFDYGTASVKNSKWNIKFHIYSTTGPDFYQIMRCDVLKATDGIIFVVDSQKDVWKRNLESWRELIAFFGDKLESIPIVIAFNKQDLIDKLDVADYLEKIGYRDYDNIKTSYINSINGEGILDAFEKMLKLVLGSLFIFV